MISTAEPVQEGVAAAATISSLFDWASDHDSDSIDDSTGSETDDDGDSKSNTATAGAAGVAAVLVVGYELVRAIVQLEVRLLIPVLVPVHPPQLPWPRALECEVPDHFIAAVSPNRSFAFAFLFPSIFFVREGGA